MSLVVSKSSGGNFTPAPAGRHQAVCVDVVDEGIQPNIFEEGKMRHQVSIVFQINQINPEDNRPYRISRWLTLSLDERASLSQFICDWLDVAYAEIPDNFDLEELVGMNARIRVIQEPKKSNPAVIGAKIRSIEPWPASDGALLGPIDFIRRKDQPQQVTPEPVAPAVPTARPFPTRAVGAPNAVAQQNAAPPRSFPQRPQTPNVVVPAYPDDDDSDPFADA